MKSWKFKYGEMKKVVLLALLVTLQLLALGQNERKYVRKGNFYYLMGIRDTTQIDSVRFGKAEMEYRKALEKKPNDLQWNFNLADALYKQMKFKEAASSFEEIAKQKEEPVEKARAYHNLGNSLLMQQQIDESIEAYKKALRQNPGDLDTKYNLAYAQMLKQQQQQQQQNQDQNKDQNQDQNKDQNKDQNQDQNQDQNKQNQDNQPQPQNKISKEIAEQLLQALQNDERNVQDKVKKEKAQQARQAKVEKDW